MKIAQPAGGPKRAAPAEACQQTGQFVACSTDLGEFASGAHLNLPRANGLDFRQVQPQHAVAIFGRDPRHVDLLIHAKRAIEVANAVFFEQQACRLGPPLGHRGVQDGKLRVTR
jgi:hypothetical protein